MLKAGQVKEIYEMKGEGRSIRGIAEDLGIARNTVRRYLKSPEAMRPKPRSRRASKLAPTPIIWTVGCRKGWKNAKVVTLGRDEGKQPIWNQRMLDFAFRVG